MLSKPFRCSIVFLFISTCLLGPLTVSSLADEPSHATEWLRDATPILRCLGGQETPYQVRIDANLPIEGSIQKIHLDLRRFAADGFSLLVEHPQYAVKIVRDTETTRLELPKHKVAYVGKGATDKSDFLDPRGLLNRLISADSKVAIAFTVLAIRDPAMMAPVLQGIAKPKYDAARETWSFGNDATAIVQNEGRQWKITASRLQLEISIDPEAANADQDSETSVSQPISYREVEIPRDELERQLVRGIRRATEILAPGPALINPSQSARKIEHGELKWIQGHRVVVLRGTPEQVGTAHGQLLKRESQKCIDSVLHTFATVECVRSGRWFRHDLEAAYERLSSHIPEDHKAETRALANALGMDQRTMEILNVFPELFHCSGFAVFGKATQDGKLYHGRVLDYMTTIGLQDAATTFVVAVDGKIPFANIGYAAFVGSVSGMNDRAISLGEMGGRGEGKWDGAPMATLMRRALEECETLDDVMKLWQESPRTCEYYYVFADGKTNRAVGVAATPEQIQFIQPGQADPRLGEGIEDAVVLSAGNRLEELRKRVLEGHGKLDAVSARDLMCRPVAMKSNLHNVLFVPEDGIFYVANATHKLPAADTPYVKLNLKELLNDEPKPEQKVQRFNLSPRYAARDSLALNDMDMPQDFAGMLRDFSWPPGDFEVLCQAEPAESQQPYQAKVRFPSPIPSGDAVNDQVTLEWHMATDRRGTPIKAPAILIVHESGRAMPVGKIFARGLRTLGFHTFLIQLPTYGDRRSSGMSKDLALIQTLMRQGVADVRRARDAIAVLPFVDTTHIALQGTSLGGFVASLAAGIDGAFESVFLTLSGGDLYSMIQRGDRDTQHLREDIEKAGVSPELLRRITHSVEPNRIAHRLPQGRTWLFSGIFDFVVPYANAESLASAANIDEGHHVQLLADHYSGIVLLPMVFTSIQNAIRQTTQHPFPAEVTIPSEVSQVLLVQPIQKGSCQVELSAWERIPHGWRKALPTMWGNCGQAGVIPEEQKREGDGHTPGGLFPISMAFGCERGIPTKLPYRQMTTDDLWVDDPNSPDYNRLVEAPTTAQSVEKMAREDGLYDLGAVIDYNTSPAQPGKGSAIFLHIWEGPGKPTRGCVAISAPELAKLLAWLDNQQNPQILIH